VTPSGLDVKEVPCPAIIRPMSRLPAPFTPDLKVLILAGSNQSGLDPESVSRRMGSEVPLEGKAFLTLRGRLVIEHVLDWLTGGGLSRIWVLAPEEHLQRIPGRYRFTPLPQEAGATPARNVMRAIRSVDLDEDEPALTVFGDHPLTTPRAVWDFLSRCAPDLERADLFHGLALQPAYSRYAPHFTRTSVWFRGAPGRATGLNLVFPRRLHRIPTFDHIYSVRKLERIGRFLSLLAREIYLLGRSAPRALLDSLVLYLAKESEKASRRSGLLGRLGKRGLSMFGQHVTLERAQGYAASLLGAERGIRIVPLPHGGAAIDVDFVEELAILERHWTELQAIARRQDEEASHELGGPGPDELRPPRPTGRPVQEPGTSRVSR